jgi:hypothetical protein
MLTKAQVLKSINALPDHFSLDELIDRFLFLNDLEMLLQESNSGKLTDHEDFKKEMLQNDKKTGTNLVL